MSAWLHRLKDTPPRSPQNLTEAQKQTLPTPPSSAGRPEPKDPNAPLKRLQLHQKCLYERTFPGNAFASAHVNRLQHGYYESKMLHEVAIDNLYFVSVHFVFHAEDHRAHRFKSAVIKVSVHRDIDPMASLKGRYHSPRCHPRILKHAPELMYGAVSPENLQWNFSLSSSLGVSQTPLAASLNPSGSVQRNYKVFGMMSIQGSLRSIRNPLDPDYAVEDGMAVWTLQENLLQRSGLPREFDFVMLIHKPQEIPNVYLTVDVDATVESWFGNYPQWYMNRSKYQPTQDYALEFSTEIGQRFLPHHAGKGFNFADLSKPLEEYLTMPGTTYPTNDTSKPEEINSPRRSLGIMTKADSQSQVSPVQAQSKPPTSSPLGQKQVTFKQGNTNNRPTWLPETLNVRVTLENPDSASPRPRQYSASPVQKQGVGRERSMRRTRSRDGLKEEKVQQGMRAHG
ncbi:hypothetical protein P154DRAFT_455282 [Amniculicola lignicola CBS 123094]|uniref:Uncharacterized protein n=1 Tax=Amniculicola lignicola CBS 123094 TaxID=1392246 RepID=A0A6A5X2U1_9PLEO|nr:hypothetical protein P154DRAFT_455282 [Amniculicola lignicola CBS 123094]